MRLLSSPPARRRGLKPELQGLRRDVQGSPPARRRGLKLKIAAEELDAKLPRLPRGGVD